MEYLFLFVLLVVFVPMAFAPLIQELPSKKPKA